MDLSDWKVFLVAVVAVAAMVFLVLGLITLARRKGRDESVRPALVRLMFALLLVAATAILGWIYMPALLRLFASDHTADAAVLRALQEAKLQSHGGAANAWSQWRGPRRDGVSDETGLLTSWPEGGPRILWRRPIGGGYSSCAIVNGRLYTMDRIGSDERVLCFDAESGKELWVYRYPANYGNIEYGAGPRATPTVHEGRVYTVGAAGLFACLEAEPKDGQAKVLWQRHLVEQLNGDKPRWGFACSPLIEGDLVIVQPGGSKGAVAAFHRESGNLAWRALSDDSGYSSPVAATAAGVRQIICFTGEGLAGLRPADGAKLWYFPWPTDFQANIATPIVAGDYVFISSSYQAGCALLRLLPDGDGVKVEPVFVRRNKIMRNHHSTCVLHEGHLYGFDSSGLDLNAFLKCLDFRSLEEKWNAGRDLSKGTLICADRHLIVLTERGSLALVEATPDEYRKKGELKLFEGSQIWALPALANGRLYLRDDNELVCVDLRK